MRSFILTVFLTGDSANSSAVHSFFTSSQSDSLVLPDHRGLDGLQDDHLLPGNVGSYKTCFRQVTGHSHDHQHQQVWNPLGLSLTDSESTWSFKEPLVSGNSLLAALLLEVQQCLKTQRRVWIHNLQRRHILAHKNTTQ